LLQGDDLALYGLTNINLLSSLYLAARKQSQLGFSMEITTAALQAERKDFSGHLQ
jgi:hypothetical protein